MERMILGFLLLMMTSVAFARAGGDHGGNGGDAIMKLFNDAREVAIKNLDNLDSCNLSNARSEVSEWLLVNRFKLMDDIRNSKHVWVADNKKKKCAWTHNQRKSDIELSEKECKEAIYTLDRAAWLLIHESVHHFGIESEEFADDVSSAVYYSSGQPNCVFDPFTVDSCPLDFKEKPLMGTRVYENSSNVNEVEIGEYRLFSRLRLCNERDGCEVWANEIGEERLFYDGNDNVVKAPIIGKVKLVIDSQTNESALLTLGKRGCSAYKKASCDFGIGPGEVNNMYVKAGSLKQKLTFISIFKGHCLRQSAKISFRRPNSVRWTEHEYLLVWQK